MRGLALHDSGWRAEGAGERVGRVIEQARRWVIALELVLFAISAMVTALSRDSFDLKCTIVIGGLVLIVTYFPKGGGENERNR